MLQVRDAVHHDFDWNGDLLFHFFGGVAGPLRDHLHVVVGDIGVSFHWQIVERDGAPNEKKYRGRQHQEPVLESEVDQPPNHYCSTVFWKTRALVTTGWPGWMPETISCMLPGSIFPPTTSMRWNRPSPAGTYTQSRSCR